MTKENPYLLPDYCKPVHYDLELTPHIEEGICKGEETILVDIVNPTKEIKLNVNEITITEAKIGQKIVKVVYDKNMQTAKLVSATLLQNGQITVSLKFESKIREDLRGFYKSAYEVKDQKKIMAATQFEATDARRCFPCFDEPALKATFAVTLIIPRELTAISNMPIKEKKKEGAKKKVVFETSPVMSTYLLAFLIAEFEGITKKTKRGTAVGVWTTPGKKQHGAFALDVAVKVLEYYESYFNIPYPLPKMDLIAIPDFESGAMENWGAVTYRERALLYDPDNSSAAGKEQIAVVVAHELAHQWFGNLVTMRWWNDLWLNEGFASWMEYKAVHHLFPEWEMWIQFYCEEQGTAFGLDGLETSHPIEVEVINPAEIDEIFDAVSYQKGASVIHMLEQYVGEEVFRKGLQEYLNKFKYANATTQDLWSAIAKSSGKQVQKIMDSWTKQVGYPLLTTKINGNTIEVTQERYFFSGRKKDPTKWYIPLALTQDSKTSYTLVERQKEIIPKGKGITLVNKNQVGFYRIQYDRELFNEQVKALQENKLDILDKIGLLANVYTVAEAGYGDLAQFLDLLEFIREENNYNLWTDVAGSIGQLQGMFAHTRFEDDLDALTRWTFESILKKVGWEERKGEPHTDTLLRITVLAMTGYSKEPSVQAEAKKRFQNYLKTKTLNPNLRGVVYSLSAWTGDAKVWQQLKQLHEEATLQEEKVRILGAMCMFQQKDLLLKTLEYSLSPAVRSQDSPIGVARVARNPFGMELAWQFLQEHWAEYMKRYGSGGHMLGKIIQAATAGFKKLEKADEVELFFKKHPVPHAKRAIEQSLENIHINHQFITRHEKAIDSWLNIWKQQHTKRKLL